MEVTAGILQAVREKLIDRLHLEFLKHNPSCFELNEELGSNVLDHFAIIDLGFKFSSIKELTSIFSLIGFTLSGTGYLPDKKNDFAWLTADQSEEILVYKALPQIVVADFRPDQFSPAAREIIEKYASLQPEFNKVHLISLLSLENNSENVNTIVEYMVSKFVRVWPLPSTEEYNIIVQENELVAWVLLYGRVVNHFGLSIHLNTRYNSLSEFNTYLETIQGVELNGDIKGDEKCGIEQCSVLGAKHVVILKNVENKSTIIHTRQGFLEFVWRFPADRNNNATTSATSDNTDAEEKVGEVVSDSISGINRNSSSVGGGLNGDVKQVSSLSWKESVRDISSLQSKCWREFFTGFIAGNANKVIESLYE